MRNSDIKYGIKFHEDTKHSELSVRMSIHHLDWDNRPKPFKVYVNLPLIPLPREFPQPAADALTSIGCMNLERKLAAAGGDAALDIKTLAEILFFSAGITREIKSHSDTYYMRSASATGALYPIELYVVCQEIPGLRAGVYHFCPADFALSELRAGDYRAELAAARGGNDNITSAPVTVVFTSIAWRNAWKYQTRSYRHWFWDAGVIAANLLATTASIALPTRLCLGFVNAEVDRLLYLDDRKEAAIALAAIGPGSADMESKTRRFSMSSRHPIATKTANTSVAYPKTLPLSRTEIDYPEIWEMHAASSLASGDQVRAWIDSAANKKTGQSTEGGDNILLLSRLSPREVSDDTQHRETTLGSVILSRGSTRRFARVPISFAHLSAILRTSTTGVPLDFLQDGETVIDIYLIANAVDSLRPGSYFFNRAAGCLERLERQDEVEHSSRNRSGYLCLGQSLFSDASAVFFLMTDLQDILKALGNRGYGAAQFEAGVIAGKIYLAAYAQGIGASGSTFYDDAVTEFLSPHASGKSTMIAVGVGAPAYKAHPGKIFAGRLTRTQLLSSYLSGLS